MNSRSTSIVLGILAGLLTLSIIMGVIYKYDSLSLSRKLEDQRSTHHEQVANLKKANDKLKQDNVELQGHRDFYKAHFQVDYRMVMTELDSLTKSQATGETIPFDEVKTFVMDVQHVYSILNQEQSDKLGKKTSDLFFGTTLMDAYPAEQADEVWELIGDIQWREETN